MTPELFYRVQEVLAAHNTAGERSWKHHHYLKGSVFCSVCDNRFCLDFATGRHGGHYRYFVCLGRRRKVVCDQRALQTDSVEEALESHWRTVSIPECRKAEIRRLLADDLEDEKAEAEADRRVQVRRIQRLKDERQKLLDGYYAGAIPVDLLKSEQDRIGRALAQADERVGKLSAGFDQIEEVITRAIAWVDSLHEAYQAATDQVRRLLNQALYEQVFVSQDGVVRVVYTEGFAWLLGEDGQDEEVQGAGVEEASDGFSPEMVRSALVVSPSVAGQAHNGKRPGQRTRACDRRSAAGGWDLKHLVELEGIEPSSDECGPFALRPFPVAGLTLPSSRVTN
nr:zinc ribbon domain-containing protein [Actinomycetota bacterium]